MFNDLVYSFRMLLKQPAFTATALITLALGITANTTIFTFVNSFLLKPFPFPNDHELVSFGRLNSGNDSGLGSLSFPDFDDIRTQTRSFQNVAAYTRSNFNLAGSDRPFWSGGAKVSADFFQTLDVSPIAGRPFSPNDDIPGATPTILLSESLWDDHFGRSQNMVGSDVIVDGIPRRVIGIIPKGHELPMEARVWIPLGVKRDESDRNRTWLNGIGRLAPNQNAKTARAELTTLGQLTLDPSSANQVPTGFHSVSLREEQLGENSRMMFYLLLGAVGLLLLIVCTNVANLQLSRAVARHGEFAIRSAIGATRGRLIRQLLLESFVLAAIAATIGLGLSSFAIDGIQTLLPPAALSWFSFDIDYRVLLYTGLIALVTTLFFGLIPALRVSHANPRSSLGSLGSRSSAGKASQKLQGILVVSEIAFALGLLAAGSIMIRGLVKLANESPGFVTKNVITASLSLSEELHPDAAARSQFGSNLEDRIKAIPDVSSIGFVSAFPLSGSSLSRTYSIDGQTDSNYQANPDAIYKSASPDYFRTMGIQLLQGRPFLETDRAGAPPVAIINQPLAKQLWGDESPLGKRLKFDLPSGDSDWVEVVGVVEGTKHAKINRSAPPQIYVAYAQAPSKRLTLAIKTTLPTETLIKSVDQQLKSFAPNQALFRVMDLERYMNEALWSIRMTTHLFWIFGAIALGLSAIGIYGVMMFSVQERHQEIGIRMALGAVPSHIIRLVIHRGLRLGLIGIGLGMIIGFLMTKAISKAILGTGSLDLVSLFYATLILLASSLLACLIPGLKAASADPVAVLRNA